MDIADTVIKQSPVFQLLQGALEDWPEFEKVEKSTVPEGGEDGDTVREGEDTAEETEETVEETEEATEETEEDIEGISYIIMCNHLFLCRRYWTR